MHCIDPDRRCTDCVRVCKYNGIDSVINKHPAQQVVLIQTKRVINTFGNNGGSYHLNFAMLVPMQNSSTTLCLKMEQVEVILT